MIKRIPVAAIALFYLIAISVRYVTEYTSLAVHLGNQFYEILTGCGPAIGAIVASTVFGIKIAPTLKGNFKHILIPFSVYWLLPIALLSIYSYLTTKQVSVMLIFTILLYGLCEEIGWRGFLHQILKRLPRLINILLVTTLWYIWQLNFAFDAVHLFFSGILLVGSWGLGVVVDKTNSFLALAAFHSLNNFFPTLDVWRAIILLFLLIVWIATIIFLSRATKKIPAREAPAEWLGSSIFR